MLPMQDLSDALSPAFGQDSEVMKNLSAIGGHSKTLHDSILATLLVRPIDRTFRCPCFRPELTGEQLRWLSIPVNIPHGL
jgi:hypothetical protein